MIYNNGSNGILCTDEYAIPLSMQVNIYSNTIYGNGNDGIENSEGHNLTLSNNIIAGNKRYGINGNNTVNSYNDVWDNVSGNYFDLSGGPGDISLDPYFVDPSSGDFHLKSAGGRWNGSEWLNDYITSPVLMRAIPCQIIPTNHSPTAVE